MAKREYYVRIPIAGSIEFCVIAENEEHAIEKAWEKFDDEGEKGGNLEWETFEHLTQGNVLYPSVNDIEVDRGPKVDDEWDDE